jgi:ubiquinone/menaquinone biosynthesis C-methylase UbiE
VSEHRIIESVNRGELEDGRDSVAEGWQECWNTFESGAQTVSDHLVELAKINPNSRVLDIATGIGEPAITAAKKIRIGNGRGYVLATDMSPQMLSIARQRASSLDLQQVIEFMDGDAETISLPASTFDAVLCRWGLMFLPDLRAGLSNIYRSMVEGGRLAAAVWASPEEVPFISIVINIVSEQTHKPLLPIKGIPGPFSLADEHVLKDALVRSRFKDIVTERINVTFTLGSPQDYTRFHQAIAAHIRAILANETQERKEEIWDAVTAEITRRYGNNSTGSVSIDNEAICVSGTK